MSDDVLILNFDNEEDGATEWLEEAQGLSPNFADGCEVDATMGQAGGGSLLFKHQYFYDITRVIEYTVPNIGASFTFKTYLNILSPNVDDFGSITLFGLVGTECDAAIFASYSYAFGEEPPIILGFEAFDNEFNLYPIISQSSASLLSDWNLIKIVVGAEETSCYLNEVVVGTWTHLIEEPFLGINTLFIGYYPL